MPSGWPQDPQGSSGHGAIRAKPGSRRHEGVSVPVRSFYREHMLSCGSMRFDDGRFQARVAITSLGGQKTCTQRFLDLECFDSHEAALDRALQAGQEWVDAIA